MMRLFFPPTSLYTWVPCGGCQPTHLPDPPAWPGTPNATLGRACGSERELEICVEPTQAQPDVWAGTNLDILLQLSAQVLPVSYSGTCQLRHLRGHGVHVATLPLPPPFSLWCLPVGAEPIRLPDPPAWPGTPNATLSRAYGSERELEVCVCLPTPPTPSNPFPDPAVWRLLLPDWLQWGYP